MNFSIAERGYMGIHKPIEAGDEFAVIGSDVVYFADSVNDLHVTDSQESRIFWRYVCAPLVYMPDYDLDAGSEIQTGDYVAGVTPYGMVVFQAGDITADKIMDCSGTLALSKASCAKLVYKEDDEVEDES